MVRRDGVGLMCAWRLRAGSGLRWTGKMENEFGWGMAGEMGRGEGAGLWEMKPGNFDFFILWGFMRGLMRGQRRRAPTKEEWSRVGV